MKTNWRTKEITLKLKYAKWKTIEEGKIYQGGVASPKYLDELIFDIDDDYSFNLDTEEFYKNGMFALEIIGTNRALKEFGKFLINFATLNADYEVYHEHIDQIQDRSGNPMVNLTVRKGIKVPDKTE